MSMRTIAVGRAPVGSKVEVHISASPDKWISGTANQDGYVAFVADSGLSDSDIRITAAGYKPYLTYVRWKPQNHQVNVGLDIPGMEMLALPLHHLSVSGNDFINQIGQRVVLNGCDGFMDFRLYMDGGEAAVRPFLDESNEFGFIARRVFMQGSKAQNQVMQLDPKEPGYYDKVRPFVEFENARGIIPILTIGIDNQDIRSPISHWVNICNITEGLDCIISYFNEWSKNKSDFNPEDIPPPRSGLWSRGSDQANGVPRKPSGPVLEFHPVRNYSTAMRDAVASPIELFEVQGYRGALVIDEPGRMGTNAHDARFTDPRTVGEYARLMSTLCAGVVMHTFNGQRGQLMDALTRDCAREWTKAIG